MTVFRFSSQWHAQFTEDPGEGDKPWSEPPQSGQKVNQCRLMEGGA